METTILRDFGTGRPSGTYSLRLRFAPCEPFPLGGYGGVSKPDDPMTGTLRFFGDVRPKFMGPEAESIELRALVGLEVTSPPFSSVDLLHISGEP